MSFKKAFSILELVFVMVIIAILVSVSIPFFSNTKQDAKITRLKVDVTALQSALAFQKNQNFLNSSTLNSSVLDEASVGIENESLFYCTDEQIQSCNGGANCCHFSLLSSPIKSSQNGWMKTSYNAYRYYITQRFFYDFVYDGEQNLFECVGQKCEELL